MTEIQTETITLGGGCFWCLEAVYQEVAGVTSVVNGYSGGTRANPTYEQVCTGVTGHAEVVQISFHPEIISLSDIFDIFFVIHNPTTLNSQGYDRGTEYRSIILYHTDTQRDEANAKIASLATLWDDPIVTEVVPLIAFYRAEDYHQNYFKSHPAQAYCVAVINPKLAKLREQFRARLRTDA